MTDHQLIKVKVKARFMDEDWMVMSEWLDEHEPGRQTKYYGTSRTWGFKDPELAMRFKLTFGGR